MRASALFSLLLALLIGCGKDTPAQHFNKTQKQTNTPFGKVREGSAVDNKDGSISFETEGGAKFKTTVTDTEAGPKYGTPTRE